MKLRTCRRVNLFQYKQAFTKSGERLCIKCLRQVPGCTLAPQVGECTTPENMLLVEQNSHLSHNQLYRTG